FNRVMVFARKPAPVQVCYLGYPGTTGMAAMDYRLTDANLDPPGTSEHLYTERSIHLSSYWCYRPVANTPEVGPLPAQQAGFITFGCLNNFAKVSRTARAAWADILIALPTSRLVIHAHAGGHREQLLDFFASRGVASQ